MRPSFPAAPALFAGLTLLLSSCGGGADTGQGPGGSLTVAQTSAASGDAQTSVAGTALASPIRVVVLNDGTASAGTSVSWSATAGSVAPASALTDANDIASGTWTLGQTAGQQTAKATVSGATGSPVSFTATATAGPAASLDISGGDGQTGAVGSMLATPLQVTARDQFGNGVAGVTVDFAVASGGGSVAPASAVSDAQGHASTVLTLPASAGTVSVSAAATGLAGSPRAFNATASPAANGSDVLVVNNQFQPGQLTVAAGTTVTFTWAVAAVGHTITAEGPNTIPSDPATHDAPHSYSVTFTTPGTYRYYCSNHGAPGTGGIPTGMSGSIVVQ